MTLPPEKIDQLVQQCLGAFYQRRIAKLSTLKLKDALRQKNLYLSRAIGTESVVELIPQLLDTYMSSSDEDIFGDAFFEPLARLVSGAATTGGEGGDCIFRELTGQAFWEKLTGDSAFFLKIIDAMKSKPAEHKVVFNEEWNKAVNRFIREFTAEFCFPDGAIDWNTLLEMNSGKHSPAKRGKDKHKRHEATEEAAHG
jgi:hypothetical protein